MLNAIQVGAILAGGGIRDPLSAFKAVANFWKNGWRELAMYHLVLCDQPQGKAIKVETFAHLDTSVAFACHRFLSSVCLVADAALTEIEGVYTTLAAREDLSKLDAGVICSHSLTQSVFTLSNVVQRRAFVLDLEGVMHHELRVGRDFHLEDAFPISELSGRYQAFAFSSDASGVDRWAYVYVVSLTASALQTLLDSGLRGYLLGFSVIDQQGRERLLMIDLGDSFDLILGQVDRLPDLPLLARI